MLLLTWTEGDSHVICGNPDCGTHIPLAEYEAETDRRAEALARGELEQEVALLAHCHRALLTSLASQTALRGEPSTTEGDANGAARQCLLLALLAHGVDIGLLLPLGIDAVVVHVVIHA
jgi:hypothetical protein